jgi:UPF0271 protein
MKIVVDTSSLFYGFQFDGNNEYITTDSVIEEVRNRSMKRGIGLRTELMKIFQPSSGEIAEVEKVARLSGDFDQLSTTDIELIALAKGQEAVLLTNDLAMQNVCRRMNIKYQSFGGKSIDTEIEWGYRCIGCHRRFNRLYEECPYCGNELKRYPKKRKPITLTKQSQKS